MASPNSVNDAATELVIARHETLILKRMCEMQAESIRVYFADEATQAQSGWIAFGRLEQMIMTHLETEREMIQRMMDLTIA